MSKPENIDTYIASFPPDIQQRLQEIRRIIKTAAPDAEEVISYSMPAFKQNGVLVYFAGYANHTGFYPTGSGIRNFQQEIAAYKNSKGAVQFPHDQPLPEELITRMVKFRVTEDLEKKRKK